MALVAASLKSKLVMLFTQMKRNEMSDEEYADKLSKIIDDYIKTATVTVDPGIAVKTAGTPVEQTGVTTSPGSGKLS